MAFVAENAPSFLGQTVGSGHCVALVQRAAGAPQTSEWRRGAAVRGEGRPLTPGTAIATFGSDGTYRNNTDGSSHAAILEAVTEQGLRVIDQWQGQPTHRRLISFRGGTGNAANDGDRFHVIETAASLGRDATASPLENAEAA